MVGDVDAVEHEGRLAAANAAHGSARDVIRPDAEQVAAAGEQDRARREPRQFVEAAAVQREIDDLCVRDDVPERSGLCVQQRSVRADCRALGDGAQFELDVRASRLTHLNLESLDNRGLKPVELDCEPIDAWIERRDDVVAAVVGRNRRRQTGCGVSDDDRDLGDGRTGRVRHRADDAPCVELGRSDRWDEHVSECGDHRLRDDADRRRERGS